MYRVSYEYVPVFVSYTSSFQDCVPGGAVEPLCHTRVPASAASYMDRGFNVCANFQEFSCMLRAPKPPKTLKKKNNIIIILRKTRGPCALLAWALNIAASSDGGPKRQCKRHPGGNKNRAQRAHAYSNPLAVWF